jgi:integrase
MFALTVGGLQIPVPGFDSRRRLQPSDLHLRRSEPFLGVYRPADLPRSTYVCLRPITQAAVYESVRSGGMANLPPGIEKTRHGTYRVRWRDDTNKQRAKSFRRLVDARSHLDTTRADLRRGTWVDERHGKITVRAFADEWLKAAMDLGDGGRDTYRRDLDRYILPVLGGIQLGRLSVAAINEYLSNELDGGLAPSTVHRHYRTLNRLCTVAVELGRITRNPCDPVKPPAQKRTEMRFLTTEQVSALAAHISPRYETWVWLAATSGLRWSECVGLRRAAIEDARVLVCEQLIRRADGKWHRDEPKTAAGRRVVTVPRFVATKLAAQLDQWSLPGPDGLVFPNQNADPMNGPSFTGNVFKPALRRAGLDDRTRIHDLRHTAVALAVKVGAHPKAIQSRMGHSSVTVTLDRYGHLFPEIDGEIAASLDGLWTPAAE